MALSKQDNDTLRRFAEIKVEIANLEEERDALKPIAKDIIMDELGPKQTVTVKDVGKLSLRERKVWQFSDNVDVINQNLKNAKIIEKADGTAEYIVEYDITFIS